MRTESETGARAARPPLDAEASWASGPLCFGVLGEMTATRDGRPLDLGGRKMKAVLAVLVLARGEVVPAESILDTLWGEQPPPRATGALHAYISHLRRSLDPDAQARARSSVIRRQGPGYALRIDRDGVDAWRFERLVAEATSLADAAARVRALSAALDLWRGPAFADFLGEPWVEAEVARLTGLREVAHERLIAARLDRGDSALVVPELETLVAENPMREERWRLLALALYRSNRQADALAALRSARQTLADELGVDPGPALREMEAHVLAQSPSLDVPRILDAARVVDESGTADASRSHTLAAVPAALPVPGQAGPGVLAQPAPSSQEQPSALPPDEFLDRDREVDLLRRCLADACDGQGRVALIEGAAGIGKTRLLAEARRLAAGQGALTLSARGSQLEREFGFGAVRQLFEPVLVDPERRASLLCGAASSASGVFATAADGTAPPADGSFAVLHGLYWLTVNAADRPLVLTVDDLQWCDCGSVRFLSYLVRRLEGLPVLIVATLRTGEPAIEQALVDEILQDPSTVLVRPGPLSLDGVRDLVRARLGDPADAPFVAACHRTTQGNPLLLRQLLRTLESDRIVSSAAHADTVVALGSRAVSSVLLRRLRRLPDECIDTARAIAILGDGAELPAVAAMAGRSEPEVAEAVGSLARAEILRGDYPLGFVHPLLGDAVYRDLPPGDRAMQHERAARVLDGLSASAEQVAAHLLHVPRRGDAWTVEMLRRAAATAEARGAAEGAAAYLGRALEEPPGPDERGAILAELGRVQFWVDGVAATRHLTDAYVLAGDARTRARIARLLALGMVFLGSRGEATSFAQRAVADLPETFVDERQGLTALARIGGFIHGLDPRDWRNDPSPEVVGEGPGARMLAAALAWEVFVDGRDLSRCLRLARFALEGRVLLDADPALFWVPAAIVRDLGGEDVTAFWDEALAHAHAHGSVVTALAVHMWRGYTQWRHGELREARHSLATSLDLVEEWGALSMGMHYAEAFLVETMLDQGDVVAARARLREALRGRLFDGEGARLLRDVEARLLLSEGAYAEALSLIDRYRYLQRGGENPAWAVWRARRAQALLGLGRRDEAVVTLADEVERARAWGAPIVVGRALSMLGAAREPGQQAERELREAVALLERCRARLDLARALAALADCAPDPVESVALLHRSLDLADRCGAAGLRRDVAARLERAGVPVPAEPDVRCHVTVGERRMAQMVADGLDVRAIAQAVFATPRTVDLTLASLRERLGVDSDAALRAALETAVG